MDETSRMYKCRHAFPDLKYDCNVYMHCNSKNCQITKNDCENCEQFKSRFIEYPITVSKINKDITQRSIYKDDIGKWCEVRIAGEKETRFGVLIGELPIDIIISHNCKTNELNLSFLSNPAIFVPELNRIVYGAESWWRIIDPDKQTPKITDDDINKQWYVQAAKDLDKLTHLSDTE